MTAAQADILRRKIATNTRRPGTTGERAPSQQLLRALQRAAHEGYGLAVDLREVRARAGLDLPAAAAAVSEAAFVVPVLQDGRPVGVFGLCPVAMGTLVEAAITGAIGSGPAAARSGTELDRVICSRFLQGLAEGLRGRSGSTIGPDPTPGEQVIDGEVLAHTLPEATYSLQEVTLRLGGERDAQIWSVMAEDPLEAPAGPKQPAARVDDLGLKRAALDSNLVLSAELPDLELSVKELQALAEGQVFRLMGAGLDGVRVLDGHRACMLRGRLGQVSGRRAVRIRQLEFADPASAKAPALSAGAGTPAESADGSAVDQPAPPPDPDNASI